MSATGADTETIYWNGAYNIGIRNIWCTTDPQYQLVTTGIVLTNGTAGSWVFFQGEANADYRVFPGGQVETITL